MKLKFAWYIFKYFCITNTVMYGWQFASKMASAKNDVENVVGFALYAGLFLGVVITLWSDVEKLSAFIVKKNTENTENKTNQE